MKIEDIWMIIGQLYLESQLRVKALNDEIEQLKAPPPTKKK